MKKKREWVTGLGSKQMNWDIDSAIKGLDKLFYFSEPHFSYLHSGGKY